MSGACPLMTGQTDLTAVSKKIIVLFVFNCTFPLLHPWSFPFPTWLSAKKDVLKIVLAGGSKCNCILAWLLCGTPLKANALETPPQGGRRFYYYTKSKISLLDYNLLCFCVNNFGIIPHRSVNTSHCVKFYDTTWHDFILLPSFRVHISKISDPEYLFINVYEIVTSADFIPVASLPYNAVEWV